MALCEVVACDRICPFFPTFIMAQPVLTKFVMTCSCGDSMEFPAKTRDEAVAACKAMMKQDAIDAHMSEKHPGMPSMSEAQCHAMIEKQMVAA